MQKFKRLDHSFTGNTRPNVLASKHNIISFFSQQPNEKRKENSPWWLTGHSAPSIFAILLKPNVKTILEETVVRPNTQAGPSCFGYLIVLKSMDNSLNFP